MAPPPRSRPALRPLLSDSAASLDRRRPRGAGGPGAAGADRAPLRPAGALPPRLQDQAGAAPHTRRAAPARPGRVGAGVRDLVADPLDPAHASAAAPPPGLLRARRRDPDRRPTGVQLPRTGAPLGQPAAATRRPGRQPDPARPRRSRGVPEPPGVSAW